MLESLRSVEVFVAAYEERSFTAAAKREHATQSGVSQHIRKLEGRLGVELFSRDGGKVAPTPAGHAYYEKCVEMLRIADAAEGAMQRFAGGVTGEISVGLMPTMTRSALAPSLMRFTAAHANVVVRIEEAYSAVLTQQVRSGDLDFAVVPAIPPAPGIRSRHFIRTIELLVSSRDGRLEHMAPVRAARLPPLKLVLPGPQNTRRRSIETYLASNGVRCERILEMDAMLGTLDFVARSDWVAVLPAIMMASDIERPTVTINPIVEPVFALDLAVIEPSRGVLSPAAQAFLDILQEETERLEEPWAPYLVGPESRRGGAKRRI